MNFGVKSNGFGKGCVWWWGGISLSFCLTHTHIEEEMGTWGPIMLVD